MKARSPSVLLPREVDDAEPPKLPINEVATSKQDNVEKPEAKQSKLEQSPNVPRSSLAKTIWQHRKLQLGDANEGFFRSYATQRHLFDHKSCKRLRCIERS